MDSASSCRRRAKANENCKRDYLNNLMKMKQQEDALESVVIEFIAKSGNEELSWEIDELSNERNIWFDELKKTVFNLKAEVEEVKSLCKCPYKIQTLDLKHFQEQLHNLSEKIKSLEKDTYFESLCKEQGDLEGDLRKFLEDFSVDAKTTKLNNNRMSKSSSLKSFTERRNSKNVDYNNIQDLHDLLLKTGSQENWGDEEHLFFIKAREQCRNVPLLVRVVQSEFPDLTVEKIVNHEAWYKSYLKLRQKQRELVMKWKEQKSKEKL